MKIGKYIIVAGISVLFSFQTSYACEYTTEISQCITENAKDLPQVRGISDSLCSVGTAEEIAYQIIFDKEMNKVDLVIEQYLENFQLNKGYYFGAKKKKNFLDAINNISNIYKSNGQFGKLYGEVCNSITEKVLTCVGDKSLEEFFGQGGASVSISNASRYLSPANTECHSLSQIKLAIYKQVNFDVLLLNKLQVSKDEKRLYHQQQRVSYDDLSMKMLINIGYIERIWAKWPSKTKQTDA
ncbi:MAG: hypothetical protein GY828_03825 [Candidatus Gracilibacteria bacterium]|nr:hypothetical protein [Candidatus Gracilibacteria bacterium]